MRELYAGIDLHSNNNYLPKLSDSKKGSDFQDDFFA